MYMDRFTISATQVGGGGNDRVVSSMQMYGGYGVTFSCILTLQLDGGEWLASCFSCFLVRKERWYLSDRKLVGPQGQSGHCSKE
jgi:hypothetical protein